MLIIIKLATCSGKFLYRESRNETIHKQIAMNRFIQSQLVKKIIHYKLHDLKY